MFLRILNIALARLSCRALIHFQYGLQCETHESNGVRCERRLGHFRRHAAPKALALWQK